MLFNSWVFLAFFAAFVACYAVLGGRLRAQNALIVVGSYVFYGAWDERFLVLIVASTVCDYLCALGAAGETIDRRRLAQAGGFLAAGTLAAVLPSQPASWWIVPYVVGLAAALGVLVAVASRLAEARRRRVFVGFSLAVNLGLLALFKYYGFFTDNLVALAQSAGVTLSMPTVEILLPVGISFYTFQTLSYTIDAYRRQCTPSRDLVEVAAYVAFFPQLVAGPIERGSRLLPQFQRRRRMSAENWQTGGVLALWGLFKKVVIADNLAPIADPVFADPGAFGAGDLLAALLAFTFQIYCDFSGYSDMARGLARILGFDLMLNFKLPYFSRTPSEFWERWHISLSSWLRDYLYIPLGGNRGGTRRTFANLVMTMLLGGLWHGASWTFIAWGAWHGGILVAYRALRVDAWLAAAGRAPVRDAAMGAGLFLLVMFGWLLFRAPTMEGVGLFLSGLVERPDFASARWFEVGRLLLPLLIVQIAQARLGELELYWRVSGFARLNLALLVGFGLLLLAARGGREFIYFDF